MRIETPDALGKGSYEANELYAEGRRTPEGKPKRGRRERAEGEPDEGDEEGCREA